MHWKEILIGSISTLVVTIIGGIVVYALTTQKPKEHVEKLVFVIESPTTFQTEKTAIALAAIRVVNQGDLAAADVKINVGFPGDVISDKKISLSSQDLTGYRIETESRRLLTIIVPSLAPAEIVQLTLLLDANTTARPIVTVRSSKTLGVETNFLNRSEAPPPRNFVLLLFPLLVGMLGAILMLVGLRRIWRGVPRGSNFNNIGFVLLHRGMIDRAADLLNRAVDAGADAPHSLANYGLCLAMKGDFPAAADYLEAAEFYATTTHEKAVVHFNRCIAHLLQGNKATAYEQLRLAVKLSKKQIVAYCRYSKVFRDAYGADPEIDRILAKA